MLIPVRCMSCGKVVGQLWEEYQSRLKKGEKPKKILDDIGLDRHCCRALFTGHVDLIKKVSIFKV